MVEEEGEDGKKGNKVKESVASREEEGGEMRKGKGPLRHESVCLDLISLCFCLRKKNEIYVFTTNVKRK